MGRLIVVFLRRKYQQQEFVKVMLSLFRFITSFVVEEVHGNWSVCQQLLAFNLFISLVGSFTLYPLFYRYKDVTDETTSSTPGMSLFFLNLLVVTIGRVISVFSQIVHIDDIQQFMDSFKLLDRIISKIGSKRLVFPCAPVNYLLYNVFVYSCISIRLIHFAYSHHSARSLIPLLVYSTWFRFAITMDVSCICFLIWSIQVSLSYLIRCLLSLESGVNRQTETIELCCKAYNEVCSQVDKFNDIFGAQLMIIFISCFIQIVDQLYLLFFEKPYSILTLNQITFMLPFLLGGTVTFSILISITRLCETTVAKGKEFNVMIQQLMIDDTTNQLSTNRKLHLHVNMKREIIFSASGFFVIDHTLLHSIGAAATTYLVILVQIGQVPLNFLSGEDVSLNFTAQF